jgi:uncharacterized protein (DUF1778 family)
MATIVNDRIDVRISKEQKELFKYASELRGFKSLSEFIVFCIKSEANKIINENNEVLKSMEDKKIFVDALLNPPAPNNKLIEAHLTYKEFVQNGIKINVTNSR